MSSASDGGEDEFASQLSDLDRKHYQSIKDEQCQVFVNDISHITTKKDLIELISQHTNIPRDKIVSVSIDTNDLNRRFSFIGLSNKRDCLCVVHSLNSIELHGSTLVFRHRYELEEMYSDRLRESRCKLFVGNVPTEVTKDQLRSELQRLLDQHRSEVGLAYISSDADTTIVDFRHKKGYCFIGFRSPNDAINAKLILRNVVCFGKTLNVELKKEEITRDDDKFISILEQAQRTLYIRDIPGHTAPVKVRDVFARFGPIRKFTVPTQSMCKHRLIGYAFVEYFSKEDCQSALENTRQLYINGGLVEVRVSDPPKDKSLFPLATGFPRRSDKRNKRRKMRFKGPQRANLSSHLMNPVPPAVIPFPPMLTELDYLFLLANQLFTAPLDPNFEALLRMQYLCQGSTQSGMCMLPQMPVIGNQQWNTPVDPSAAVVTQIAPSLAHLRSLGDKYDHSEMISEDEKSTGSRSGSVDVSFNLFASNSNPFPLPRQFQNTGSTLFEGQQQF